MQNCAKQTCQAAVSVHVINYYKPSFPYFCATIDYMLKLTITNACQNSQGITHNSAAPIPSCFILFFPITYIFVYNFHSHSERVPTSIFLLFPCGILNYVWCLYTQASKCMTWRSCHSWRRIDQVQSILPALELLPSTAAAYAYIKLRCLVSDVINLV